MPRPHRIVSLLPSATEIVCAVGAGAELVGISHECDFPDSIRGRAVLTRSRIAGDGSSGAIDSQVRPEQGRTVRAELERRIEAIAARAAAATRRPRVASIEWLEPLMLGGTWMPELIERAGGRAVGVAAGEPAPTIDPADLRALQPDVVLIKPCGFRLERTLRERALIQRSIVASVGPGVPVYLADGSAYFNRPGPRLVESLEILAACLHPEIFGDAVPARRFA